LHRLVLSWGWGIQNVWYISTEFLSPATASASSRCQNTSAHGSESATACQNKTVQKREARGTDNVFCSFQAGKPARLKLGCSVSLAASSWVQL